MTTEEALKELKENGFQIERINENEFLCYDNGRFGFAEEEEPFAVDAEGLLDIHETYLNF
jgi:hypothetical protein